MIVSLSIVDYVPSRRPLSPGFNLIRGERSAVWQLSLTAKNIRRICPPTLFESVWIQLEGSPAKEDLVGPRYEILYNQHLLHLIK